MQIPVNGSATPCQIEEICATVMQRRAEVLEWQVARHLEATGRSIEGVAGCEMIVTGDDTTGPQTYEVDGVVLCRFEPIEVVQVGKEHEVKMVYEVYYGVQGE